MATTLVPMPAREVLRCEHCALVQFRTSNSLCRRCHKPLDVEEVAVPTQTAAIAESQDAVMDTGMQVAHQVKEIRRARHMSQRQLASRMQVPRTYISKIENGKAIPTLGSLDRLAHALGVDICQLVRDGHSRREEEVRQIMSDDFLAEIASLLPNLDSLQRSMLLNEVRERSRERQRDQLREMAMVRRRTA